jgi:hypothetical protein
MIDRNERSRSPECANLYPAGVKVSDTEMAAINIVPHEFHGEWNYSISPTTP